MTVVCCAVRMYLRRYDLCVARAIRPYAWLVLCGPSIYMQYNSTVVYYMSMCQLKNVLFFRLPYKVVAIADLNDPQIDGVLLVAPSETTLATSLDTLRKSIEEYRKVNCVQF